MQRLLVNAFLLTVAAWFALLDHCVIVSSGMPASGQSFALLIYQLIAFALLLLLANGAFPVVAEAVNSKGSFRLNMLVFGFPLLLLFASPALISVSLYEARYGVFNRGITNSHVAHDLSCCWNPFSRAHG